MSSREYKVIIPDTVVPVPDDNEVSAAKLLADHFQMNVVFIARTDLHKTPDVTIGDVKWEIKSPRGSGKRTIQHQFYRALKQSNNIVIDARRSKLHGAKLEREVKSQFMMSKNIKRLILIKRNGEIIDYGRKI